MKKKNSSKKYFFLIILVVLAIWGINKYVDYSRYTPPVDYSYQIKEDIDINYHDQLMVQRYYENVYKLSSFANEQWNNYKIDVRFADHEIPQSILANKTYVLLKANTAHLEKTLINSFNLKKQGLDNKAIKFIEQTGVSPEDYHLKSQFARVIIAEGDRGKDVERIQEKLVELGYPMQIDGIFKTITEKSLIDYQDKNGLFPSGVADQETLQRLFKEDK